LGASTRFASRTLLKTTSQPIELNKFDFR